jgi:hypothetical protein
MRWQSLNDVKVGAVCCIWQECIAAMQVNIA